MAGDLNLTLLKYKNERNNTVFNLLFFHSYCSIYWLKKQDKRRNKSQLISKKWILENI
jgi:hypothetical protein